MKSKTMKPLKRVLRKGAVFIAVGVLAAGMMACGSKNNTPTNKAGTKTEQQSPQKTETKSNSQQTKTDSQGTEKKQENAQENKKKVGSLGGSKGQSNSNNSSPSGSTNQKSTKTDSKNGN